MSSKPEGKTGVREEETEESRQDDRGSVGQSQLSICGEGAKPGHLHPSTSGLRLSEIQTRADTQSYTYAQIDTQ